MTVKLLSWFLYPLNQALLLCLIALLALLARWYRLALGLLALGVAWLYLCSTPVFANFLLGILEDPYPPKAMSVTPEVDAIVVLGGAIRGDTHMGALGDLGPRADRIVHAFALYQAGKAPRIVVSGGSVPGTRSEAEMIRDVLVLLGVPAPAIVLEDESRTTHDNAVLSAERLESLGASSILLVTSAFHMRRAEALFLAHGLEVIPAPTDYQRLIGPVLMPVWLPSVASLMQSTDAIHELLGYWVYRLQGRI